MPIFDFKDNQHSSGFRIKPLAFIALGTICALLIGSNFAANVNLNSNRPVEFGKGVSKTVFCNGSKVEVKLTPISSFVNAAPQEGGGSFSFTGLKLQNIPSDCLGSSFKFKAYNGASSSPLVLSSCAIDGRSIAAYFNGDNSSTGVTDNSINDFGTSVVDLVNKSSDSFELSWNGTCTGSPLLAADVYRITIESFNGPTPADGSNLGGFSFANCDANTLDPCPLYGSALGAEVYNHVFTETFNPSENTGPQLRLCPSGYAVIGIKAGDNQFVGEVSPICAQYTNRSVEYQFTTWSLENPGYLVSFESYIKEQRCTGQNWVTGFGGRAGAINDAIQPICRAGNGRLSSATLGTLFGGQGGGLITSKRCVQGEVVTGIWVWGLNNRFTDWGGAGGGQGLAFRCTRISNL